ncbi:hypothetical protein [Thermomonospora cellulosilytica]|uniref:Tetratricopeptide TPR_4 n=1 Tax=Thermomonospora cellulosilytica TaxID=1411118 RepID=A0A7W3RAT8_9ACTN|nr:hypothetical protein [Thermomonospora cellulosilytica]MBA9006242.1 hypothetical protein [Thermomonospora cellulosilytica]
MTGDELDAEARAELRTLPRDLATKVARHLVMAGRLIDEEPDVAYQHARAARRLASRVGIVREAAGLAAYHAGEWADALAELRAARRLRNTEEAYLPILADCERGLGRPERALDLAKSPAARRLDQADRVELRIVESGARRDLGQHDAAVVTLQIPELRDKQLRPWSARLFYAYADALLDAGREKEAVEWFARSAAADRDGVTDAPERYAELEGLEIIDLEDEIGGEPSISAEDALAGSVLGSASEPDEVVEGPSVSAEGAPAASAAEAAPGESVTDSSVSVEGAPAESARGSASELEGTVEGSSVSAEGVPAASAPEAAPGEAVTDSSVSVEGAPAESARGSASELEGTVEGSSVSVEGAPVVSAAEAAPGESVTDSSVSAEGVPPASEPGEAVERSSGSAGDAVAESALEGEPKPDEPSARAEGVEGSSLEAGPAGAPPANPFSLEFVAPPSAQEVQETPSASGPGGPEDVDDQRPDGDAPRAD